MKTLGMLAGVMFGLCGIGLCGIVASAQGANSCEAEHISSRGTPTTNAAAVEHIQTKLDEQTELEFIETPLQDVIEYLKNRHHLEIQLDKKALEESAIATDTPITRNIRKISLRSALKLLLRNLDLAYTIRDEVLLITTRADAESFLDARVYQVCDLVNADADGDTKPDYEKLTSVIQGVVAPTFWNETGGPGAIKSLPAASILAVAATEEVHEQVEGLLSTLRMARDAQKAQ